MIVGVGTDVLEVLRMTRELRRGDGGFVDEVFSPAEKSYCASQRYPARHYAARFAAKEAAFKALGSGLADGLRFRDVEVGGRPAGAPYLILRGRAKRVAQQRRVRRILVSLAHTARVATACVILES